MSTKKEDRQHQGRYLKSKAKPIPGLDLSMADHDRERFLGRHRCCAEADMGGQGFVYPDCEE